MRYRIRTPHLELAQFHYPIDAVQSFLQITESPIDPDALVADLEAGTTFTIGDVTLYRA